MNKVIICLFIIYSSETFSMEIFRRLIGTSLLGAIETGDDKKVCDLIARGYDVNQIDDFGENGLHKVVSIKTNQAVAIARALVAQGIKIDHVARNCHTPLLYAVLKKKRILVDFLVRMGADPWYTPCPQLYSPYGCAVTMEWEEGLKIFEYYQSLNQKEE